MKWKIHFSPLLLWLTQISSTFPSLLPPSYSTWRWSFSDWNLSCSLSLAQSTCCWRISLPFWEITQMSKVFANPLIRILKQWKYFAQHSPLSPCCHYLNSQRRNFEHCCWASPPRLCVPLSCELELSKMWNFSSRFDSIHLFLSHAEPPIYWLKYTTAEKRKQRRKMRRRNELKIIKEKRKNLS